MSDQSILNYLPPGWTEEKNKNATNEDFEALTEEQLRKYMERSGAEYRIRSRKWWEDNNKELAARGATQIPYANDDDEDDDVQSEDSVDPAQLPTKNNLNELINTVQDCDWEKFGFVLFRTYFGDEQLWENCLEKFYELLEVGIADVPADSGFSDIDPKIFFRIMCDEVFADYTPDHLSASYQIMCVEDAYSADEEEGEDDNDDDYDGYKKLEPGMAPSMFLMVDEECMRSVAAGGTNPAAVPFVKAVDGTLCEGPDLKYSGVIKVAITAIMPKFYAAINANDPGYVASKTSSDGIWSSIGPWDADMEGKKIMSLIE